MSQYLFIDYYISWSKTNNFIYIDILYMPRNKQTITTHSEVHHTFNFDKNEARPIEKLSPLAQCGELFAFMIENMYDYKFEYTKLCIKSCFIIVCVFILIYWMLNIQ